MTSTTRPRRGQHGHTLLEMTIVMALLVAGASAAAYYFRAYSAEAHLVGAARVFKGTFLLARSTAVRTGVYTAIRFEPTSRGWQYSVYADGDNDGVQSADITTGRDKRIAGPIPLSTGASSVRVGINPGVPAPPPDSGMLDPHGDPIRFGAGDMLSFSPLGTATPGTFYLAGEARQAAVRVTGGSARVRTMVCRGTRWMERQ